MSTDGRSAVDRSVSLEETVYSIFRTLLWGNQTFGQKRYGTNRYGWKSRGKGTPKKKKKRNYVRGPSWNLYPIPDQNMWYSFPYFRPKPIFQKVKSFITFFVDVNECAKNPCKNGATCTNTHGSYKCTCDRRFTGKNCDQGLSFVWIIISHLKAPKLAFCRTIFPTIVNYRPNIYIKRNYTLLHKDIF